MSEPVAALPFPDALLHYADPAANPQILPIAARVDRIHSPTLGAPALLTRADTLRVVLSLPAELDPGRVLVRLVDRHREGGDAILSPDAPNEDLGLGPDGTRRAWLFQFHMEHVRPALYDLGARWSGGGEVQPNAVRVFSEITGEETVVLCGDAQYNVANRKCLARWVERLNAREDIAWVALIGDVCDNGVIGGMNMLRLGATASKGPVVHRYAEEFPQAHALLASLRHPVVLVPGNHDGMVAYENNEEGTPTTVVLGADPTNRVAYDGLHHYRRTFGPLYHRFDWAKTRYLCLNSFELPRHHRLGYGAIVANWGGGMGPEQIAWVRAELEQATALGLRKVVFMHHDPRGGSLGYGLGRYHALRPFAYNRLSAILGDYLGYLLKNGRKLWQQEWMHDPSLPVEQNSARELLNLFATHRVEAVVMGHDNLNWWESYAPGDDLFATPPAPVHYRADDEETETVADAARSAAVAGALRTGDLQGALAAVEGAPAERQAEVLDHALAALSASGPLAFGVGDDDGPPFEVPLQAPLTFLHVNDVGAYAYDTEAQMGEFGYIETRLHQGAPASVRNIPLNDQGPGQLRVLPGAQGVCRA